MRVPPLVSFEQIRLDTANSRLSAWEHKMGPLHRGNQDATCHGLFHGSELVAVTTVSTLISAYTASGVLTRGDCCELSRLCAARPGLCRVALRLWREFVLPGLPWQRALSYQDSDLHSGNTYRFDGWQRLCRSRSGPDTRSGRPGRNKWIWIYPHINVGALCPECSHDPCDCLEKFAMSINFEAVAAAPQGRQEPQA